jgi:benzodiazapine receptor
MHWLPLILSIFVCELVGISGTIFTVRAIPTWYAKLKKPSFNPPNGIFGPVWTILYALQGIAIYLVIYKPNHGVQLIVFIIQLILNTLWTPLFFGAKKLGLAFAEILLMLCFIIATIISFSLIDTPAAWLMIPYALWVAFASILNYKIWKLN